MPIDNQSLLLEKITGIFVGTHDFRELANQAVDLIAKELKNQHVVTVGIGRVHEKERLLHAYAYATKYRKVLDKLLPKRFSELNIALDKADNLGVKTVTTGQIQQSKRVADFSRGIFSDQLADKLQKIMKGKLSAGFPIRSRSGKTAGFLLLILDEESLTGQQMLLFQAIANQLGLAFSNVFAFEKLVQKYKNSLAGELAGRNDQHIPSVKFTLRITPQEDKKLAELARQRGKTKAEIIREVIDKDP